MTVKTGATYGEFSVTYEDRGTTPIVIGMARNESAAVLHINNIQNNSCQFVVRRINDGTPITDTTITANILIFWPRK